MPNNQMDYLINEAKEAIAQKGIEASDRQVMLACFGWLGKKLDRLPCISSCPTKNDSWKRWAFIGLGLAAGFSGAGAALKLLL